MNQSSTTAWSQPSHHDPMVSAAGEDFASFLDLDDFNLDFGAFEAAGQNGQLNANGGEDMMDTGVDDGPHAMGQSERRSANGGSAPPPAQAHTPLPTMDHVHHSAEALMEMNMQTQLYQNELRMQAHGYGHQSAIPPTPTSIEMSGGSTRYHPQIEQQAQAQAMLERYQRMKEEQMVFTPLVSPAVTPLETQFNVPEYTVPGAYFSPLTSPALGAQHHSAQRSVFGHSRSSENSIGTSPVDLNFEESTDVANGPAKRARRKTTAPAPPRTSSRVVRQSPAMKGQRRKPAANTVINAKDLREVLEAGKLSGSAQGMPGGLPIPQTQDSSEAESISPEPLSESLMGPPPAPRHSSERSPFLAGMPEQNNAAAMERNGPTDSLGLSPATPASLMRLPNQPVSSAKSNISAPSSGNIQAHNGLEQNMEDMTLPEAATASRPPLSIHTRSSDEQTTPTLSAKKTPTFRAVNGRSGGNTPTFQGVVSPTGARKGDIKSSNGIRQNKKRNSTTSVQVSPALRPKISPSIAPSVHDSISPETSALLLASKSNYQNILEGTHLPGVTYPEALSTNLTSKRTSHKIAEQGRRNRINNALKEIEALLPPAGILSPTTPNPNGTSKASDPSSGGSGGEDPHNAPSTTTAAAAAAAAAAAGNSKASTVEMAIEYIKMLRKEVEVERERAEKAEKALREVAK